MNVRLKELIVPALLACLQSVQLEQRLILALPTTDFAPTSAARFPIHAFYITICLALGACPTN